MTQWTRSNTAFISRYPIHVKFFTYVTKWKTVKPKPRASSRLEPAYWRIDANSTTINQVYSVAYDSVYDSPAMERRELILQSPYAVKNLGYFVFRLTQFDRLVSSYCSLAYHRLRLIIWIRNLLTRDSCHAAALRWIASPAGLGYFVDWTMTTSTDFKDHRNRHHD